MAGRYVEGVADPETVRLSASALADELLAYVGRFGEGTETGRSPIPACISESHRVPTLDVETGLDTGRIYSRAKVIDMIFFVEGARRLRPRRGAG